MDNNVIKEVDDAVPYKVQVTLSGKYRPLILRGRMIHEQTPKSAFPAKRRAGNTNLDLWLDGKLYPADSSGKRPKFGDVRSVLEFFGEGENGMLGYTKSLLNWRETLDLPREDSVEIDKMRRNVEKLSSALLQQRRELDRLRGSDNILRRECEAGRREVQLLQIEIISLRNNLNSVKAIHADEIADLQKELDDSVQAEVALEFDIGTMMSEHAEKVQSLHQSHAAELTRVKLERENAIKSLAQLQRKWDRLQSTPYGCLLNKLNPGSFFAKILSKTEVKSILQSPALKSVTTDVTNKYLDKIGEAIGVPQILGTCDATELTEVV